MERTVTAQDRQQLIERITRQHERDPHPGVEGGRLRLHIAVHAVVETQLQQGAPPQVQAALERLMDAGLARHDAIHAIGSVASQEVVAALSDESGGGYDEARYVQRLEALDADEVRRAVEEEDGGTGKPRDA